MRLALIGAEAFPHRWRPARWPNAVITMLVRDRIIVLDGLERRDAALSGSAPGYAWTALKGRAARRC